MATYRSASLHKQEPRRIVIRSVLSAVVAIVGLALIASGCGGHGSTTTRSTNRSPSAASTLSQSTSTDAPPPSAMGLAEAQATAAYLGMWQDFVVAGLTSDWQSPSLSTHATGDALLQMSRGLYADHLNGLITKGQPVNDPTVRSATPAADPSTVLISDCGDSSHWLKYNATTGTLRSGSPGGRQAITAEVEKQADGSWKVDQFAVEAVGTC